MDRLVELLNTFARVAAVAARAAADLNRTLNPDTKEIDQP